MKEPLPLWYGGVTGGTTAGLGYLEVAKIPPWALPALSSCRMWTIEEGRAASKVLIKKKFGYFLSMSQQAVSADIIPNSAVWAPPKGCPSTEAGVLKKLSLAGLAKPAKV